jgi:adenylate cyclase
MSFNTQTETPPRYLASSSFEGAGTGAQEFQVQPKPRIFPWLTGWLNVQSGHGEELERLTLISEQRRMAILAPLLTGLTLLVVAFGLVAHSRGALPAGYDWILLIGSLACAYEWIASRYLAHALKRGFQPARFRFYMNALVELSVPMVMTLVAAAYTNPANALSGPASYIYFLFIVLSALRLDFRLCLFTGAVASLGYGYACTIHWNALKAAFSEPSLTVGFSYFVRALLFLLGGIVAGLVSARIRKSLIEAMQSMRDRQRVITLFGQHVSPNVVNRLLTQSHGEASELRNVCVLVLDIRNFTGFAEKRSPAEVVSLLNTFRPTS